MLAEAAVLVGTFFAAALAYFAVGLIMMQFLGAIEYEPNSELGEGVMMVIGFFIVLPTLIFVSDLLDNIEEEWPTAAARFESWIFRHAKQHEERSDDDPIL